MLKHKDPQSGFTLMEAMVATFLFASVLSAMIGIYISVLKLNSRSDSLRVATEFTRYLSETMSKEIRNGNIDYFDNVNKNGICNSFPDSAVPDYRLSILDVNGDHLCYFQGDNYGVPDAAGDYLWLAKNNFAPVKLNSNNVKIRSFKVYTQPLVNPYCHNPPSCSQAGSTEQPMVTFAIEVISNVSGKRDQIIIPFETSVSIPVYDIQ